MRNARYRPTVRFWVLVNGALARVKLDLFQSLSHIEGGDTAEGYDYTWSSWTHGGDTVKCESMRSATDRARTIEASYDSICRVRKMRSKALYPFDGHPFQLAPDGEAIRLPQWQITANHTTVYEAAKGAH